MCYKHLQSLLFLMDPEKAHALSMSTLHALDMVGLLRPLIKKPTITNPNGLERSLMGLKFPNPVGAAAGIDKNGEYIDAIAALGFGFIEIGGITPKPQPGNPTPRVFRIPEANALINRLGFNSKGVDYVQAQLERRKYQGILGIQLAKNTATTADRAVEDYQMGMERLYAHASYFVVNVSCGNVKGFRDMQNIDSLKRILDGVKTTQQACKTSHGRHVPIVVKVSPDESEKSLHEMTDAMVDFGVEGVEVANATLSRPNVAEFIHAGQEGSLSGEPLRQLANQKLKSVADHAGEQLCVIGIGGISKGEDAVEKLDLGADLVQFYTGLVYQGPGLVRECVEAIDRSSM